jgi:hypothetical protein
MDWAVGSLVEALFEGDWWDCHVIAVAGDLLTIHYVDGLDSDDETLPRTSSRLRPPLDTSHASDSPPHRTASPSEIPRMHCALPADDPAVWEDIASTRRAASEDLKALREALGRGPISPGRWRLAKDLSEECGPLEDECDAAREVCAIYRRHFALEGAHRGRGVERGEWREGRCFHVTCVKTGERSCDLAINLREWMADKIRSGTPGGLKRKASREMVGGDVSRRKEWSELEGVEHSTRLARSAESAATQWQVDPTKPLHPES